MFKNKSIKYAFMGMIFRYLKRVFDAFSEFVRPVTERISLVVNTILLTIVYFVGVGLTFCVAKLARKKFLKLEKENTNSYWIDKDSKTTEYHKNFRQF